MRVPRIVIGALSSGAGKTTATVAVAAALARRGLTVACFKCGPDYLDPTYHARATGRPSQNLDGWMMGRDAVLDTFGRVAGDADIALVEGVMGLFDGAVPTADEGSTAEIARWLTAPVLLCVDASGMARTIAALAAGVTAFAPDLTLAGVLANGVGGRAHLDLLAAATPLVVGGFPRMTELAFAERHLGLRTADETVLPAALVARWAEEAERWLDLDRIVALARAAPPLPPARALRAEAPAAPAGRPPPCRIGIAHDEAFHFYYEANLALLEDAGATLVRFSPLHDPALPADLDGLFLGGGYPEAHARALAGNASMRRSIRDLARRGAPVYAECGGLMYLSDAIRTLDGVDHPMVGLVRGTAVMSDRLRALGYVTVTTVDETPLGPAGLAFRGHQFRYSELVSAEPPARYAVERRHDGARSSEGHGRDNVLASYVHAHWASCPLAAAGLVETAARWRARSGTA